MELKTARLTVLVDPAKKKAFEALCARQDVTPSQVVRQLIRDYLAHHGVEVESRGTNEDEAAAPASKGRGRPRGAAGAQLSAGAARRKR